MLPAFIYARFSSLEQAKGHSLERQLEDGRAHIGRNGWEYHEDRELRDEGRSAFSGENRQPGSALYDFEQQTLAGAFKTGVVLVVENIDRLTRQGYEQAFDLLRQLTQNGVTVATTQDNQIYPAGDRIDMAKVMMVIIKAELALDESTKKSKRIKAVWKHKVDQAIAGNRQIVTPSIPAWLTIENEEIKAANKRVTVLREIYDWYCAGHGLSAIVNKLNSRKEANWTAVRKAQASGWNTTYIHRLLTNRSVLGEFRPFAHSRTHLKDELAGTVIPDYFPAVVTAEQFNRVQGLLIQRQRTGGKAQHTQKNLFSGIARCSECQGVMYYQNGQKVGTTVRRSNGKIHIHRTARSYLKCNNARRNHNCSNKTAIRYEVLVNAILDTFLSAVADDEFFKAKPAINRLREEIAEQERQKALKETQLNTVVENLVEAHSKALAHKAAQLETEVEELDAALSELRDKLKVEEGAASPEQVAEVVKNARAALESDDPEISYAARLKVHQVFQGLFSRITCFPDGETAAFVDGLAVWCFDKEGNMSGGQMI
ncbi:recombinase family protein [Novosphingobium sp.]|uniref:recombinase family protein n=1 Tax=Novosphingobium sp. TaxID=1874826 RepID=UPI002FD8E3BA